MEHSPVDTALPYIVQMAKLHRSMFEAYVEQGFDEAQALYLVGQHIANMGRRKK